MNVKRNLNKLICAAVTFLLMLNLISMQVVTQAASATVSNEGMENAHSALKLNKIAGYDSGETDGDGGVMEIVAYNAVNGFAYAVNGKSGVLAAIAMQDLTSDSSVKALEGNNIDVKNLVNIDGFEYGDMTSVAVSPDGKELAVAIQAKGYADNGRVAFFTCNDDGSLLFTDSVEVGIQPDMITFTPDGSKILTANEGEARNGYGDGVIDPAGSVSIIAASEKSVNTVGFEAFDDAQQREALVQAGIVLKKNTPPSVDLEPEYIACSNTTAYISLQEANAIAVLSLESNTYTGIYSVGFEDYSKVAIDIDKNDKKYNPKTYNGLFGIRMPDGISLYTVDGTDYILTANEGDSRKWEKIEHEYSNEQESGKGKASPAGNIPAGAVGGKVTYFKTADYDGLTEGMDYLFGSRSFTMFKVSETGLEEVFDSASDFEEKTNNYFSDYFNCSNDDLSKEDRSGKKGPEPETVTVGAVGNQTYVFVSLERIGGIMVYDITDPANVTYQNYINSRDFSDDIASDDSPEGLCFVAKENSSTNKALLLAACEVGGTVAVYELDYVCFTHTMQKIEATDSTCETQGNHEYYYCTACGRYFKDADGTAETSVDAEKLELAQHTYEWKIDKEATATENGIKHEECTVCGDKRNENTDIPAVGPDTDTDTDTDKDTDTDTDKDTDKDDTAGKPDSQPVPPQTGDSCKSLLLTVLFLVSGICLAGIIIYSEKRRTN